MSWQPRRRKYGDTEILLACIFVLVFMAVCCGLTVLHLI